MTSALFAQASGIVARRIAGETILVPARRRAHEMALFTLDPVGTFLWQRLDGETDERALAAALTEAFDVDAERAARDLGVFLRELAEADLVREVSP